jgi:hypothetical protein
VAALYEAGGPNVLRVKADATRNRIWVLSVDELRVYDAARKALMSRVRLPGWFVLESDCSPDFALDHSGSAFITDNVQAKVWRVDAASFAVSEHDIRLQWSRHWDIGFSSVAFTPNGSLYALSSTANSLWKIDATGGTAELVEFYHPPINTCALTKDFLNGVERNRNAAPRPSGHYDDANPSFTERVAM